MTRPDEAVIEAFLLGPIGAIIRRPFGDSELNIFFHDLPDHHERAPCFSASHEQGYDRVAPRVAMLRDARLHKGTGMILSGAVLERRADRCDFHTGARIRLHCARARVLDRFIRVSGVLENARFDGKRLKFRWRQAQPAAVHTHTPPGMLIVAEPLNERASPIPLAPLA